MDATARTVDVCLSQEHYADYVVLDGHHFCIPIKQPSLFMSQGFGSFDGRGNTNE